VGKGRGGRASALDRDQGATEGTRGEAPDSIPPLGRCRRVPCAVCGVFIGDSQEGPSSGCQKGGEAGKRWPPAAGWAGWATPHPPSPGGGSAFRKTLTVCGVAVWGRRGAAEGVGGMAGSLGQVSGMRTARGEGWRRRTGPRARKEGIPTLAAPSPVQPSPCGENGHTPAVGGCTSAVLEPGFFL